MGMALDPLSLHFVLLATSIFTSIQPASSSESVGYGTITPSFPNASSNHNCPLGSGETSGLVANDSKIIWPYQIFKSASFNPPKLEITTYGKAVAPGHLFISPTDATPINATKDDAPLIMTDRGQLVWHGPNGEAFNLHVASYQRRPILTYWSGIFSVEMGHGYGNVTFLSDSYEEILTVCPQFGLTTPDNSKYPCEADLHESQLTARDTLLVTAYNVTAADLSSIGGPTHGWIYDSLFFELSPDDGSILFRWSSLEHVPVNQTRLPLRGAGTNQSVPFDYFHINSVTDVGDAFMVNARHTWSTYLVSSNGDLLWTLQGDTGGDFGPLPGDGHFAWQHHARPHAITNTSFTLTLLDNHNTATDNGTHPTIGLELQLPLPPNRSTSPSVLKHLSDPSSPIYAIAAGSVTLLPNGNTFIEYGYSPVFKEFAPNGSPDVLYSARFGVDNLVESYRGFKAEWAGYPKTKPSLFVDKDGGGGCGAGYVSWNGATGVEGWVVFEGDDEGHLERVGTVGYRGFETRFGVRRGGACVQVAAMMKGGKVGSRSDVVCV